MKGDLKSVRNGRRAGKSAGGPVAVRTGETERPHHHEKDRARETDDDDTKRVGGRVDTTCAAGTVA